MFMDLVGLMGFNGVSIIMFMGLGVFGVYWHY
jgi:hypothetical protein